MNILIKNKNMSPYQILKYSRGSSVHIETLQRAIKALPNELRTEFWLSRVEEVSVARSLWIIDVARQVAKCHERIVIEQIICDPYTAPSYLIVKGFVEEWRVN